MRAAAELRAPSRAWSLLADYVALTKPRIVSLLVFTGVCGAVAAAGRHVPLAALVAVAGGGGLAAGGAGAINVALEADIDGSMRRTRNRPVAAGRIAPTSAIAFGLALNALGGLWLAVAANPLAAMLALAGSAWYVGVYTLGLKMRSPANIVIGGAAGSFPPLAGWAAATGHLDITALALGAVVFLWTPPHFWALATLLRDDYRRAGVPMLPAVVGLHETARHIMRYAVACALVGLAPVAWGGFGGLYLAGAAVSGGQLVRGAVAFRREPDRAHAGKLFRATLICLPVLFLAAALDRLLAA
jgi:protoheme IX farnesyltransferase